MALSQTSVLKLYKGIIEDTIASSREAFLDEGMDEQVLLELKHLWETKLTSNRAVQLEPGLEGDLSAGSSRKNQPVKKGNNDSLTPPAGGSYSNNQNGPGQTSTNSSVIGKQVTQASGSQGSSQNTTNPSLDSKPPTLYSSMLESTRIVPIQITLPPPTFNTSSGVLNVQDRVITIQVPASALIGNQLQQALTGPVVSAAMSLPQQQASTLLQQHVNAVLQGNGLATKIPQTDGQSDLCDRIADDVSETLNRKEAYFRRLNDLRLERRLRQNRLLQTDGSFDDTGNLDESSEDEELSEDPTDDDDDGEEEKDDEDPDLDEAGLEEEPLNSEDDVSEEDPTDLFDTDNVIVCQYDKINRSRNKWKFYLKDGIMNLNGKDFVFQKLTGDAEW